MAAVAWVVGQVDCWYWGLQARREVTYSANVVVSSSYFSSVFFSVGGFAFFISAAKLILAFLAGAGTR